MKKGNDIDNLFREGLGDPEIPFNDADWQAMEERLDLKKKRRIVPLIWFTAAAGIAAMLLIVLFTMKPEAEKNKNLVKSKVEKGKENQKQVKEIEEIEKSINGVNEDKKRPEGLLSSREELAAPNQPKSNYKNQAGSSGVENAQVETRPDYEILSTPVILQNILSSTPKESSFIAFNPVKILPNTVIKSKDKAFAKLSNNKPRLVLSILAAPDLTSVEYSGRSNLSGSFGAELTLFLTKKLSVTTGANYAKKIYESDFSLYNPNSTYVFKTAPSNIRANCDVIDIPLNVNYKLLGNNRNSLTLTTGLSSYLMLKEQYSYTYLADAQGPKSYEVKNQNQHYLGIANVGVEFQHKINNKLSISARPFMKIPLTNIGYGNSKLSSTGVAVSVNMNLFKRNY